MAETILVLNAGSSSIKFQLFAVGDDDGLARRLKGQIDGIGTRPTLRVKGKDGEILIDSAWPASAVADVPAALDKTVAWLQQQLGDDFPSAIGHRVAHGGPDLFEPTMIDDTVLDRLARLVPLAPLHQPNNLAPIRAVRARRPDMPQVACFDTAFHHRHSEVAVRYAIPDELHREGVRRYGFHGLSYEYIASVLPRHDSRAARGKAIVLHLGNGASMCAIDGGKSVASTMGFTAELKMDARAIERLIYQQSGLLGVSGISSDMRTLEASAEPAAKAAIDLFIYRIGRELGSLAAALGGLEAIVFTAGIGENSSRLRERVSTDARWLGVELDRRANASGGPRISTSDSRVAAWVIPTDEELMIARHTRRVLAAR
jgi:acetate kinase